MSQHPAPKPASFFLAVAAAAALLAALADGWPYGYFTFLRFAVTIAGIGIVIWATEHKVPWMQWTHGITAILFNPIVKIYLKRDTWRIIDLAVAVAMIVTAIVIRKKSTGTSNQ